MTDTMRSDTSRTELDKETIAKAYARWAPVYDLVFGAVFEHGRHAAIAAAERIGGRILEVGVGTGLSLPYYSADVRLCGVDISEPMLRKAQQRVTSSGSGTSRRLPSWTPNTWIFPTRPSTWSWRNTSSPRCRTPKPRSTNSPAS